ncbi:hypothetical protein EVAR_43829_1 [Eumeta japonica]|uniref:Uncharacterized protein n=1 Tax=Eumeta variegata TaxID=151549 RepID=A0A4C1X174_EUMVA|nr:hypothetical protein EVAR_43829_1 [Eumeta japonica]
MTTRGTNEMHSAEGYDEELKKNVPTTTSSSPEGGGDDGISRPLDMAVRSPRTGTRTPRTPARSGRRSRTVTRNRSIGHRNVRAPGLAGALPALRGGVLALRRSPGFVNRRGREWSVRDPSRRQRSWRGRRVWMIGNHRVLPEM